MKKHIAVLAGDGIGPEITDGAIAVLNKVGEKFGHEFEFEHLLMGVCAIEKTGEPLPQYTIDRCLASDSVLLGAVGGAVNDPRINNLPGHLRPEAGLLKIRAALGLYSNLRPAKLFPALAGACPLRKDIAEKGIDLVVVRELIGGIYFGDRGRGETDGVPYAYGGSFSPNARLRILLTPTSPPTAISTAIHISNTRSLTKMCTKRSAANITTMRSNTPTKTTPSVGRLSAKPFSAVMPPFATAI